MSMSNLHRTQIYLSEDQMQRLKLEGRKEDLPMSELIRSAIDRFLSARTKSSDWGKDPLTKAIGKIKLSVTKASVRHDETLYG